MTSTVLARLAAVLDIRPTTPPVLPVEAYLAGVEISMAPGRLAAAEIPMVAVVMNTALGQPAVVSEVHPITRLATPAEACPAVTMTATEVEATRMALAVKVEVPIMMIIIPRAEVSRYMLSLYFILKKSSSLILCDRADSMAGKLMDKAGSLFKKE